MAKHYFDVINEEPMCLRCGVGPEDAQQPCTEPHEHEWDENGFCVLCGWDGNA